MCHSDFHLTLPDTEKPNNKHGNLSGLSQQNSIIHLLLYMSVTPISHMVNYTYTNDITLWISDG